MSEVRERPTVRTDKAHVIRRIGIIGAGQMGSGIAHVCALAGFNVLLNDVRADRIKAGIATINGNMARQVAASASPRMTGRPRSSGSRRRRASTTSAIAIW